jgi:acid stress-induced BolA-like protein IbaG/YrbA
LELKLKEIVTGNPLSTNVGLTLCERLEKKNLVRKQQMTKATLSSKITNP